MLAGGQNHSYFNPTVGLLESHRAIKEDFSTPLKRLDELHKLHRVSNLIGLHSLRKSLHYRQAC